MSSSLFYSRVEIWSFSVVIIKPYCIGDEKNPTDKKYLNARSVYGPLWNDGQFCSGLSMDMILFCMHTVDSTVHVLAKT